MFDKLNRLFSRDGSSDSDDTATARRSQLAATALLLELCRADQKIEDSELQAIIAIARNTFDLSQDEADALLDKAAEKNQLAVSLYEFTDTINRQCEKMEKIELIENMWRVALADQSIDRHEEHLIRKVADLIYVGHSDFIRAKHRVSSEITGD